MKYLLILTLMAATFFACNKKAESNGNVNGYESFGEKITPDDALTQEEMLQKFQNMKPGDTVDVKFASNVNSVCKAKGCWMKLDLNPTTQAMVKFKDYGFFVPMNAENSKAIVHGKAFVGEIPVEELRHYAEDAGESEEEIAAITEPETTYNFVADGVLLQ